MTEQSVEGDVYPYCTGNKLIGCFGMDCGISKSASFLRFEVNYRRSRRWLSVKPGMAGMGRNKQEWIGMDRNKQEWTGKNMLGVVTKKISWY